MSLIDTETVILKDCCSDSAFIIDMIVLLDVGKLQIKDSGFITGVDYCNINKFWVVTSSGFFFYLKTGFCRIVQTGLELIILPLPDQMPGLWACTTIPGFISSFLVYLSKLTSMIDYKWGVVVHKTKQEKKSVCSHQTLSFWVAEI